MESFRHFEKKLKSGQRMVKTVDFVTTPGSIILIHSDRKQVEKDTERIHALCIPGAGLYEVQKDFSVTGMVANGRKSIKNAFRSGADLAAEYPLVALTGLVLAVGAVAASGQSRSASVLRCVALRCCRGLSLAFAYAEYAKSKTHQNFTKAAAVTVLTMKKSSSSSSSSPGFDRESFNPADPSNFEPIELDLRERVVVYDRK